MLERHACLFVTATTLVDYHLDCSNVLRHHEINLNYVLLPQPYLLLCSELGGYRYDLLSAQLVVINGNAVMDMRS